MIAAAKVTSKGQVTIPKEIREFLSDRLRHLAVACPKKEDEELISPRYDEVLVPEGPDG